MRLRRKLDQSGLLMASFGSLPQQVSAARLWGWNGTKLSYDRAYPLMVVLSELHSKALWHTASGDPCGRVRLEMEAYRGVFRLAVTGDGPLTRTRPTVPEAGEGFGLRLVEKLDAEWVWFGEPGTLITAWAVVDPRGLGVAGVCCWVRVVAPFPAA